MRYLSLFSGIEAASSAWAPLGWTPVAFAEIEPFPSGVLSHHYPNVTNLGDITKITQDDVESLGHLDLVVGGFPCQDVSIAGKRAGLKYDDGSSTRSGLFFTAMRIAEWARARWLVVENVPGLFNNKEGADFAAVVGAMAGCKFDIPRDGWRNAGVAVGPLGLVEWTVLDAQYHGLAQRRRRVFIVRDSGDWRNRSPLFLEPYRLQGHPAPRRETGKGFTHDIAPSLTSSGRGVERGGDTRGQDPVVAMTLNAHGGSGRIDAESETFITHALRGEGFDASEDGTGRGTPLVAVDVSPTLNAGGNTTGGHRPSGTTVDTADSLIPMAFDCKASGQNGFGIGAIASTLRSMGHANSHQNGGGHLAVAMNLRGRQGGAMPELDELASLRAASGGSSRSYVATTAVRRLTPRECERLQGFPDDHTLIKFRNKLAADGPRYKALGNSMAVPVMRYIGQRIADRSTS